MKVGWVFALLINEGAGPVMEGMLPRQDQQRPFIAWPGGQKCEAGYALSG